MTPEDQEQFDQLKRQVRVLETRLQAADDLMGRLLYNGLDDMLKGHGNQYFGGGVMRVDQNGMQIKAPTSAITPIFWLADFSSTPSSVFPNVIQSAYVAGTTDADLAIRARGASSTQASVELNSQAALVSQATLSAALSGYTTPQLVVYRSAATVYVRANAAPFWLADLAADPTTTLSDGMLWYRSDTDKFRVRANASTENLATESWVTANASSGYANPLMLMGG